MVCPKVSTSCMMLLMTLTTVISNPLETPSSMLPEVGRASQSFPISCAQCRLGVGILVGAVRGGKPVEDIVKQINGLCNSFKLVDKQVCDGVTKLFVPSIVEVVKRQKTYSASDACAFMIGPTCDTKDYQEKFGWTVPMPSTPKPPVKPLVPPKDSTLPKRRILHISDTHLDLHYTEGSNADCGLPLCCRGTLGMPTDPSKQAGKYGDYRHCDSPPRLLESMYDFIQKNEKVDFILWTGDIPTHDVYNLSQAYNRKAIKESARILQSYFPNTPIFPAVGNHEAEPVNVFPVPEESSEFSIKWLYDELSQTWPKLIGEDVTETINRGGYYSVLVEPFFRVISLNVNYCNFLNWWLILTPKEDPTGQLGWLVKELENAELNNEKVYIIGHYAPGDPDCSRIWSRNFRKIVSRFENTIVAQFYGHTHYDEIKVYYDDEEPDRVTNIAYVGASTTPFSFLNPSFKMFTADGDYPESTRMILDGDTYYMDLDFANKYDFPEWEKLYTYTKEYDLESLTPENWGKFIKRLISDSSLMDKFITNMHRKSPVHPYHDCDDNCAKNIICDIVTHTSHNFTTCSHLGVMTSAKKAGFRSSTYKNC